MPNTNTAAPDALERATQSAAAALRHTLTALPLPDIIERVRGDATLTRTVMAEAQRRGIHATALAPACEALGPEPLRSLLAVQDCAKAIRETAPELSESLSRAVLASALAKAATEGRKDSAALAGFFLDLGRILSGLESLPEDITLDDAFTRINNMSNLFGVASPVSAESPELVAAAFGQQLSEAVAADDPRRVSLLETRYGMEAGGVLAEGRAHFKDMAQSLGLEQVFEFSGLLEPIARKASGKAKDSVKRLASAVRELTQAIAAGGLTADGATNIVLKAIHDAMGFQRTALLLVRGTQFNQRMALGEARQMSIDGTSRDVFAVSLERGADIYLQNILPTDSRFPGWFAREYANVRSLLLLPVVVSGRAVGAIYGDRSCSDDEGLSQEEVDLMRTLRNSLVAFIRAQRRG